MDYRVYQRDQQSGACISPSPCSDNYFRKGSSRYMVYTWGPDIFLYQVPKCFKLREACFSYAGFYDMPTVDGGVAFSKFYDI